MAHINSDTNSESYMNSLTERAPTFLYMAHTIVWCSAATADKQGLGRQEQDKQGLDKQGQPRHLCRGMRWRVCN